MQFVVKRDILLKSLNFVQGVVEKKNTLPILSNVLLQLKDNKLSIVATDLDIVFYNEISDAKIINEGSTTTSAAILYDILRKISSNCHREQVLEELRLRSHPKILVATQQMKEPRKKQPLRWNQPNPNDMRQVV